jgi:hypothetical protein
MENLITCSVISSETILYGFCASRKIHVIPGRAELDLTTILYYKSMLPLQSRIRRFCPSKFLVSVTLKGLTRY